MRKIEAVIFPNRNFSVVVGREFMNTAYTWQWGTLEKHAPNMATQNARVAEITVDPMEGVKILFENGLRPPLDIIGEPCLVIYGENEEPKEEPSAVEVG